MTFDLKFSFYSLFSNVLLLKNYNKLNVEVKITWIYCLIWVNPSRLVPVSFTVLKHHQPKQHELVWLQFTVPHHSLPLRQVKAGTEIGKEHGVKDYCYERSLLTGLYLLHCSPHVSIGPRTTTLGVTIISELCPTTSIISQENTPYELLPDVTGKGIFSVDGPASQVSLACMSIWH